MNHFFLLETLMAGPAGIEPATLQLRRLLPSPLGEGPMWWARWESNPQNFDFESNTYANSVTRPKKY